MSSERIHLKRGGGEGVEKLHNFGKGGGMMPIKNSWERGQVLTIQNLGQ